MGGARQGEGPQEVGQSALPPDWTGLLVAVGVIVTGHSGFPVAVFLYI